MSENLRKLIGVVVMAVLVVVGVAVSSGDDTNFTRNSAFVKLGDFQQLPEAEQARLAPAFAPQAASRDSAYELKNVQVVSLSEGKTGKAGIWLQSGGTDALGTGKTSVLEGRGVDGKGGTSSKWREDGANRVVSGRKAGIWLQNGGTDGVADRIAECANDYQRSGGYPDGTQVTSVKLKDVILTSYTAEQATDNDHKDWVCVPSSESLGGQEGEAILHDTAQAIRVGKDGAGLLATCMESKVGDVFLKSHIEVSAADCVATVQSGGTERVADRIAECASGGNEEMKERAAPSIIAILIALFSDGVNGIQEACANGTFFEGEGRVTDDNHTHFDVGEDEAGLLAECMESKVGGVFLKSHVKVSAADCVATVMPAISPDRAKRLGTYWQTQQQLARIGSEHCWPCD